MSKITNTKVTIENMAEGSFKFNHSVDLYKIENILANPNNKNKAVYKEKLQPFSYGDYSKVQVGSAGCQEFYDINDKTKSKGFFNENAGAFFPENIHYPLSGDLKGVTSNNVKTLISNMHKNLSEENFINEMKFYRDHKINNVDYLSLEGGEIIYNNPPFYNGYVTSRKHHTNYVRFNSNKKGWLFDDLNASYSTEEDFPNLFNCDSSGKITKKEKIARAGSISIDTFSITESSNAYNRDQDSIFVAGPFKIDSLELKENNYLTFSLYTKSSSPTEIKGINIIPASEAVKAFRKNHGSSSYEPALKISENNFENSYPTSANLGTLSSVKNNYLKVETEWKRFYKIFKYTKAELENNYFYAVIIWPNRTCLEEKKLLENPDADRRGSNRSSKEHTAKKEISFAGINIEITSSPSGFDSRYMHYKTGYEAPLKEHPLIFNLDLKSFTKSNPLNWLISYKRKFESKGISEEDLFVDSLTLYSGIYKWGYKKDKIYATTNNIYNNISALDYYNNWEEVFIYPKDAVNLWLEVKGINNYSYKIELNPISSPGPSKLKGIPFNLALGAEIFKLSDVSASLNIQNGSYRDLYVTSLDNLQKLKEECIRVFKIADSENNSITVFQTDFLEER